MNSEHDTVSVKWAMVTLGVVAVAIIASGVIAAMRPPKDVNGFDECVEAGGARMESYPEQCLHNGRTFVNEAQRLPKETGYVGMKEDEALLIAEENKIPARVVERDGESLPATMDFIPGRHNFYVRDGMVYKVDIESESEASPPTN